MSEPADVEETVEPNEGSTRLSTVFVAAGTESLTVVTRPGVTPLSVVTTGAAVCVMGLLGRPGRTAAPAGRPVIMRSTRPNRIPTAAPTSRMNARGMRIPIVP